MFEYEQLALFDKPHRPVNEPQEDIFLDELPSIALPTKVRELSIRASLDEVTAKRLIASWHKQLKRFDKDASIEMKTQALKSGDFIDMPFVCVDTETTGLDRHKNRVIEIAWVHFESGRKQEAAAHLCRISESLPPEIVQLTGITDAMLAGEKTFSEHVSDFLQALSKASFIVAYNAPFDKGFIEAECARAGYQLPNLPWVDPCVFVKEIDKYQKGKKLTDAARRWGVELDGAHRALADATATGHLLYKLAPALKVKRLEELLKMQEAWRVSQDKSYQAYLAKKGT